MQYCDQPPPRRIRHVEIVKVVRTRDYYNNKYRPEKTRALQVNATENITVVEKLGLLYFTLWSADPERHALLYLTARRQPQQ